MKILSRLSIKAAPKMVIRKGRKGFNKGPLNGMLGYSDDNRGGGDYIASWMDVSKSLKVVQRHIEIIVKSYLQISPDQVDDVRVYFFVPYDGQPDQQKKFSNFTFIERRMPQGHSAPPNFHVEIRYHL